MTNWDLVAKAIDSPDMKDWEIDQACESVAVARNKWLEEDRELLDVHGVELKFEYQAAHTSRKGFIDLWGIDKKGIPHIFDWKFRQGEFTEPWIRRQAESPQGDFYYLGLCSTYPELGDIADQRGAAAFFTFRGINAKNQTEERLRFITQDHLHEFSLDQEGWDGMRRSLSDLRGLTQRWPRNKPDGCRPFGPRYPCEFEDYCYLDKKLPEAPEGLKMRASSYSSDKEFKRCPERARLLHITRNLDDIVEETTSPLNIGRAFHRGIAEVWRQEFMV